MNNKINKPAYIAAPPANIILKDDLVYENDNYIIQIYAGYRSDGGSIPRIAWSILGVHPFDPRCTYSFITHDFLYQSKIISRSNADQVLAEILEIAPACGWLQRFLIWSHVRLYGWIPWKAQTPEETTEAAKFGEIIYKGKLLKTVIK